MLADRRFTVMLPAHDVDRARGWDEDTLGLRPDAVMDYGVTYTLPGGTPMSLYPTKHARTARHTLPSIDTGDLTRDMTALRSKGVAFEDYNLPDIKPVDGVAEFGPVKRLVQGFGRQYHWLGAGDVG